MAEDRGAYRTSDEAHRVDAERAQSPSQRILVREVQLREHRGSNHSVEEEVVPLDGGADRAGDDSAPQLNPVLMLGQRGCRGHCTCHDAHSSNAIGFWGASKAGASVPSGMETRMVW